MGMGSAHMYLYMCEVGENGIASYVGEGQTSVLSNSTFVIHAPFQS